MNVVRTAAETTVKSLTTKTTKEEYKIAILIAG